MLACCHTHATLRSARTCALLGAPVTALRVAGGIAHGHDDGPLVDLPHDRQHVLREDAAHPAESHLRSAASELQDSLGVHISLLCTLLSPARWGQKAWLLAHNEWERCWL